MSKPSIEQISHMISEDADEPLITVSGFGRMTRRQALQSTITYLRQMAEKLEEGYEVPLNYFDMAKDHYDAYLISGATDEEPTIDYLHSGFEQ